jgi:hypothetical protein
MGEIKPMPELTQGQMESPEREAVWQAIKSWDVNVPGHYEGYCGATGSHVAVILNALGIDGTQPAEPSGRSGGLVEPSGRGAAT